MTTSQYHLHWKIEFFNEGSQTCDRSWTDYRFDLDRVKQKAVSLSKHWGYKKAVIFANIPFQDVDEELIGLYEPELTIIMS